MEWNLQGHKQKFPPDITFGLYCFSPVVKHSHLTQQSSEHSYCTTHPLTPFTPPISAYRQVPTERWINQSHLCIYEKF